MRFQYYSEKPAFTVQDIDVVNVVRDRGFIHSYRSGRIKHGFIYTVKGEMCATFVSGDPKGVGQWTQSHKISAGTAPQKNPVALRRDFYYNRENRRR